MRAKNGVILAHFFCKYYLFNRRRLNLAGLFLRILCTKCCQERADTDPCCSQVIDLINLQTGVDLVTLIKNLIYFICGNCIQPAPKGIQLDQIQVISCLYKIGSCIQAGVIHPLVVYTDRTFYRNQVGYRVFCEYSYTIAVDQVRDAMVDLRVDMVWTACKNDASAACFFHIFQCFFPFAAHILTDSSHFLPGCMCCSFYFICRNILEDLCQTFGNDLFRGQGKEWVHEFNGRIMKLIHIVFDIFSIRGNDGAVVVVDCVREFVPLVRNTRVENEFYTIFQ